MGKVMVTLKYIFTCIW